MRNERLETFKTFAKNATEEASQYWTSYEAGKVDAKWMAECLHRIILSHNFVVNYAVGKYYEEDEKNRGES